MIDFKKRPFNLNDEDIRWVNETFGKMTLEDKCGQIFCPMGFSNDDQTLHHLLKEIKVGAMMYRPAPAKDVQDTYRKIQDMADIPLLLAANIEAGADGLCFEGSSFGQPMAVAATGDDSFGYRMGKVACSESAALGLNWAFAPIVDINYDFHNPITNVRTFGSDPQKVIGFAKGYLKAAAEENVATAIKHFPGDGVDERDQHIVTSVNDLSYEEWMNTYGRVYSSLIEYGSKTVMVGHIAAPKLVRHFNDKADRDECLLPGSLSRHIMTDLLRNDLGFNGVISTDSSIMTGFTSACEREKAIPLAIENGADIFLFNKSIDEDYGWLIQGVRNGLLSMTRLDEAVLRILALKASLKLHEKKKENKLVPSQEALSMIGNEEHQRWILEAADRSVTLVRDNDHLLPLSVQRYPRIYLNVIEKNISGNSPYALAWKELFENEGFEVTLRDRTVRIGYEDMVHPETMTDQQKNLMYEMYRSIEEVHKDYDLYVYVVNMENASNNTTLRLNWNCAFGLGDDVPWFVKEIPTLMISTAYPYHLFDAPMISTYINTYANSPVYLKAVMEKIMGRSGFKGISPVDPFCGKEYL